MNVSKYFLVLTVLAALFGSTRSMAQYEGPQLSGEEVEQYKEEATFLVRYLEGTLNELGNPSVTPAEKGIIIQNSYSKLFRDDKVQIEDDLDPNREAINNKDVQAYLKDIEFFFDSAHFEFIIGDISHSVADNGELYFTVELTRKLFAESIKGEQIDDTKERFVEINLDEINRVLKIASIYTTKLSQKEEMAQWWSKVPMDWKHIFANGATLTDSTPMENVARISEEEMVMYDSTTRPLDASIFGRIEQIRNLETLDVSNFDSLADLSPLSKLKKLRSLNLATIQATDLMPLRSLTKLEELHIDSTQISDLTPLRYLTNLKFVSAEYTPLRDLSAVANFTALERLNISHTLVTNFSPLRELKSLKTLKADNTPLIDLQPLSTSTELQVLDVAYSNVTSLDGLQQLKKLERVNISGTSVEDLSPLKNATLLKILFADQSSILDLTPLKDAKKLERIYCDNSNVSQGIAVAYMQVNPTALVIYDSEQLRNWWSGLSQEWKSYFVSAAKLHGEPNKEELQQIANITEVNIEGNQAITSLDPLTNLVNLRVLVASGTNISDLTPISRLLPLESLQVSDTKVSSLQPISGLVNLRTLEAVNTQISDLTPLSKLYHLQILNLQGTKVYHLTALNPLSSLVYMNCEQTPMDQSAIMTFNRNHASTEIIFRTGELQLWWTELPEEWKEVFKGYVPANGTPSDQNLHKIGALTSINVSGNKDLKTLEPLKKLFMLQELQMSNTRINSIEPLSGNSTLEVLACDNTPVENLSPIGNIQTLKKLDFSNSLVEDIDFLENLYALEELRMSGNENVKDLKPLSDHKALKILDCSNTNIKHLKYLENADNLKNLKCYKTRLNSKKVAQFKQRVPQCEVDYY
ncbi:leucine-rich repeat domain-containing protein [Limibacter armeniacum]|uniref:leucine-rich repeat domain-containing protein n=1 Tax=Limibacter armeniacum TaxID=466084 RepID=UPI002FE69201